MAAVRQKRDEISKVVAEYERRLAKARDDLAHVTGAIALFESTGDINRLFRKGEAIAICKEALRNGPLTAKQMVVCIMEAKGFDPGDLMLSRAITGRLHNSPHHQLTRGGLIASGKKRTAWFWRLP